MHFHVVCLLVVSLLSLAVVACANETGAAAQAMQTSEIIVTSAAGARLEQQANVCFTTGEPRGATLTIYPANTKQTMDGLGTSFTEASAFVLAHLDPAKRDEVMRRIFGEDGANFTLARTHIGACDFTVEGRYSYDDQPGDATLAAFSIDEDRKGFDSARYPSVRDSAYDLLPMIRQAQTIKRQQADSTLHIIASAWTAPAWMKDIEDWYIPGSPQNNWQGTGGSLKYEHTQTYADYLVKYLQAYREAGVDIWGLTPVNEPHGNNGQWESMGFSPETQNRFVKWRLGPALREAGFSDVKLLIYDQNRDGIEAWTNEIFADPQTAPYVYGVAVHWYESTNKVYEDTFERVHARFPEFAIIHTEGCIDDLGKPAPDGVADPEGFREENWFGNDDFWWNDNATDWAYTVPWQGVNVEDHPKYAPVHRYARNIIVSIDHWLQGWIDWNIVLDRHGGPNHVGNFCGAPIMVDTQTQQVYYTPVFYVLEQFSRTIRPGDKAVQTLLAASSLGDDDLHACATVNSEGLLSVQLLNTTGAPIDYNLRIGERFAPVTIPANAVQTVRVRL